MNSPTEPSPADVAAFIQESIQTEASAPDAPPPQVGEKVPLNLKTDEVQELQRSAPGLSPEPDLAFMPTYPEHMQTGIFAKYSQALQEMVVTPEERDEYIRALAQIKPENHLDACHQWDIGLIHQKFIIRVRSLNGYELHLVDRLVSAAVNAGERNPGAIKTLQVFSMITMMAQSFNGAILDTLSFDPKRMSDATLVSQDAEALLQKSRTVCAKYSSAQIKLMTSALQAFEAKSMKCQVAVFDESF